jgi:hypothetical protein
MCAAKRARLHGQLHTIVAESQSCFFQGWPQDVANKVLHLFAGTSRHAHVGVEVKADFVRHSADEGAWAASGAVAQALGALVEDALRAQLAHVQGELVEPGAGGPPDFHRRPPVVHAARARLRFGGSPGSSEGPHAALLLLADAVASTRRRALPASLRPSPGSSGDPEPCSSAPAGPACRAGRRRSGGTPAPWWRCTRR